MRYLALGDSYTIGEGVAPGDRWPVQLAELLRGTGFDFQEPDIIARTGWTSDELAEAIELRSPSGPYDLVSLLIGVNNQYRGLAIEQYAVSFAELLDTAVALAGGEPARVLVLSIPDWSVTPYAERRDTAGIRQAIDLFNNANREAATDAGAHYVDVTAMSRSLDGPLDLAEDGLHYSRRMYERWARAVFPVAVETLRRHG